MKNLRDSVHSVESITDAFKAPDIPEKKKINALISYARSVKPSEVELLIDDTVFGSAKDGMIFTNKALYGKEFMCDPFSIEYSKIHHIKMDKEKDVYVNGKKIIHLNTITSGEILFERINAFISELKNTQNANNQANNTMYQQKSAKAKQKAIIARNSSNKYKPKNKEELKQLLVNKTKLADIDTSNIADMSNLFTFAKVDDFSGIETWNVSNVVDMSGMFSDCRTFNKSLDSWNVSNVKDMSGMFVGCENFNQPLNSWNVSNVENMIGMFNECENFNQPLNSWNVSKVTDMNSMFRACKSFNQPLDAWDVSNVVDMSYMFAGCESFNQSLDSWNVSNTKKIKHLFDECKSLAQQPEWCKDIEQKKSKPKTKKELIALLKNKNINLANIDTSDITDMSKLFEDLNIKDFSGIETWDVSNVTNMSEMFSGCTNFNQPLNSWNVSSVTDMSRMFFECFEFNQPLDSWDVSNVTNMSGMFSVGYFIGDFAMSFQEFNQPLNSWNVSNVKDMSSMFVGCQNFNQPLDSWDVSNVTNMNSMFGECSNFNQPLNSWDVSNVVNMSYMFSGCENFNQPLDSWNVSNVVNMSGIFSECKNFNQPLNSWDVSNVVNMSYMFSGCENFNQSLDSWDISNVTDMSYMFYTNEEFFKTCIEEKRCGFINKTLNMPNTKMTGIYAFLGPRNKVGLIDIIDQETPLFFIDVSKITDMSNLFVNYKNYDFSGIETWDVSNVENMARMFAGCVNFNEPLKFWNVSKVTNMAGMFGLDLDENKEPISCENFNKPLDTWDVSNVTNMHGMFSGCKSFNQPLNSWNVSNVTNMKVMFYGCTRFNQPLDSWNVLNVEDMSNMFTGCVSYEQPLDTWLISNDTNVENMFLACPLEVMPEYLPQILDDDYDVEYNKPDNSKSSSAIAEYISNNGGGIVNALKRGGITLTESALENDMIIARIAGIIHNLLPGFVRIFVSQNAVEEFLHKHKHILIDLMQKNR